MRTLGERVVTDEIGVNFKRIGRKLLGPGRELGRTGANFVLENQQKKEIGVNSEKWGKIRGKLVEH